MENEPMMEASPKGNIGPIQMILERLIRIDQRTLDALSELKGFMTRMNGIQFDYGEDEPLAETEGRSVLIVDIQERIDKLDDKSKILQDLAQQVKSLI